MNFDQLMNQLIQLLVQAALPHLLQAAQQQAQQPAPGGFGNQQGFAPPAQQPQQFQQQGQPPAQQFQQPGMQQGFGGAPAQQVTPEMIQQLITPLVQNEQIKAMLTQQMHAMGIQNLPEAQPHQLPELYARFQQVQQQTAHLLNQQAGAPGGII